MIAAKKARFSLVKLIITDIFTRQKLSFLLLALIIISAVSVLLVTREVRRQQFAREQLLLEKDVLDSEWRNLIIEENVLADPKRIEQKAQRMLGMQFASPNNETVIVTKKAP